MRDNARALFRTTVDIAPESEVTRNLALTMVHSSVLADYDWPGFIDTERFRPAAEREPGARPILGRHSRDAALKWPEKRGTTLAVYSGDENLQVRILGGVNSQPQALQEELRARAEVIEFGGEETPEEFLRGLDFWAYFHSSSLTESFGMSSVEAMASGLVVFLPKYMEPNFGDAAIYVEPEQVHESIRAFWDDPGAQQKQAENARRVVVERYSSVAFSSRLERLMERGKDALTKRSAVSDG